MRYSLKKALLGEGAGYDGFTGSHMMKMVNPGVMNMPSSFNFPQMETYEEEDCEGTEDCGCAACEEHEHEEEDEEHYHDHHHHRDRYAKGGDELEMVLSNLQELVNDCTDLLEMMQDCGDVEEWVQEKIATSQDRIHAVHGYVKYKTREPGDEHGRQMLVVRRVR